MTEGIKSSEFEKSKIKALKKVGKSQREILKILGRCKTVICNYWKSPKSKEQENQQGGQKNFHHNSR